MKRINIKPSILWMLTAALSLGCQNKNKDPEPQQDQQSSRAAWYTSYPDAEVTGTGDKFSVSSPEVKLYFFGWSADNDYTFNLEFPDNPSEYQSAIITYRMGAWNEGCSAYDNTTALFVKDKSTDE